MLPGRSFAEAIYVQKENYGAFMEDFVVLDKYIAQWYNSTYSSAFLEDISAVFHYVKLYQYSVK